jgi:hypothetical protein
MSRQKKITGDISLYTWSWDYVITQRYQTKRVRNEIIQKWIKHYRLKDKCYVILIKPIIDESED